MTSTPKQSAPGAPKRGMGRFLLLSYAITWLTLGPWFYAFNGPLQQTIPWWAWVILPILILGGWGPSVAAVICEAMDEGKPGVKRLFRKLLIWRIHPGWYVFVLLLPLVLTGLAVLASDFGATAVERFALAGVLGGIPLAYLSAIFFGPCEELGWRGYALPRWLHSQGLWRSTVFLGTAWTFWHTPMLFLMPGAALPDFLPPTALNIGIYLIRNVAITGIMTYVFCHTNGSALIALLFHLTFNTSENIVFSGMPSPTNEQLRQIYFVNIALLCATALACLAWLTGRETPRRRDGRRRDPDRSAEQAIRITARTPSPHGGGKRRTSP